MTEQALFTRVVALPVPVCTRVDAVIDDPRTPYDSFSRYVEVALRNQLELDSVTKRQPLTSLKEQPAVDQANVSDSVSVEFPSKPAFPNRKVLIRSLESGAIAAPPVMPTEVQGLTFLTNRLNPVPVVVRILSNLGPMPIGKAAAEVTAVAQEVGEYLQRLDDESPKAAVRRMTSWPLGVDRAKSRLKFRASYLVDDLGRGPLRDLSLAQVVDGQLVLTQQGIDLSRTPSPLLGETEDGGLIGPEARDILSRALISNPKERGVLKTFFAAFEQAGVKQQAVDRQLSAEYGWNPQLTTSQRAAITGRLRDLDLIELAGRGPDAKIWLTTAGSTFRDTINELENE